MREHSSAYYLIELVRTVRNWPLYLLQKYGIVHPEHPVYKLRNGMRVHSRSYKIDRGAINEVWLDRIYDPPNFPWSECKTVIDVGANIGTFTLFAAYKAQHARVIAFEPAPGTAAVLQKNVDDNNLGSRLTVDQRGLANDEGTRTFYISERCSWFSSLYHPPKGAATPMTITVTTLKTIFDQYKIDRCDFLKIDCEGTEYESLYNLPEELWPKIRFMAIEYHTFTDHPKGNVKDLTAFLEGKGYRVTERENCVIYATRIKD